MHACTKFHRSYTCLTEAIQIHADIINKLLYNVLLKYDMQLLSKQLTMKTTLRPIKNILTHPNKHCLAMMIL